MPRTKICTRCGDRKPATRFHRDRRASDGRRPACADCEAARRQAYLAARPGYHREYDLRRRYGITLAQYEQMAHGGCHICRGECNSGKRLAVDHDHATGRVRGVLCANCNRGVGMFDDDPGQLRSAAAYLERAAGV